MTIFTSSACAIRYNEHMNVFLHHPRLLKILIFVFKIALLPPLYLVLFMVGMGLFAFSAGFRGVTYLWWTPIMSAHVLGIASIFLLFFSRVGVRKVLATTFILIFILFIPHIFYQVQYSQYDKKLCGISAKEMLASCDCAGITEYVGFIGGEIYCRGERSNCMLTRYIINSDPGRYQLLNSELEHSNAVECSELDKVPLPYFKNQQQ